MEGMEKAYGLFNSQVGHFLAEGDITAVTVKYPKLGLSRTYGREEFGKLVFSSREAAEQEAEAKECGRYEAGREDFGEEGLLGNI